MRIFAMHGSELLGKSVANASEADLAAHEEREFTGGEHKARPLVSVRGEAVYVIHSLNGTPASSVNDKLCRLLFFIAACRQNGAKHVTAIVPYLAYSRKDRQTKARDPVTTRYIATLFEAVGTDRVITLDVHNVAAFQNAFRCETVHLSAKRLFCRAIGQAAGASQVTVFSPDGGGIKRAQLVRELFEAETGASAGFGFMEKRRSRGKVSGDLFAGDVEGHAVFIVDDMIESGGTMLRAAEACRDRGARSVHVIATHGLLGPGSQNLLQSSLLTGIVLTDSVSCAGETARAYPDAAISILPVGPLIADAVRLLDAGEPISSLLGMED
ncbi:ribose-phosphate diphosphokinase [Roseibium litorale]|uniref:ribose-phosphate diphosphokinase n=1 Tax=Roseibium litorale TaxID=2803841 RepID=A0ABR9CPA6_9HYPH|nr:ribose-phosphate diphosphokinase [Roseibium litorale]MBD8892681.1 ribose-phosphate pyrophosphokinase [Roseibium litorale]